MGKHKRLLTTVICSVGILIPQLFAATEPPQAASGKEKATVLIQDLKETADVRRLVVPVRVEAKLSASVTADTEGFVTKIRKPLGSTVKAGEIVLYIENKDPGFTYAAVPVRAPVTGVISQMNQEQMSRVHRGDKLFNVMDPAGIKLVAEIPGSDLPLVEQGAMALFKPNIADLEGLKAKVIAISPLVDPQTSTACAQLEFVKDDTKMTAPVVGTVGFIQIEKSRGNVLMIPENALSYADGKPIVKIIGADGTVIRRSVELGDQRESQLIVKGGLALGDKIIVRASRSVKEGEAVDIQSEESKKQ